MSAENVAQMIARRPLSAHAMHELHELARAPIPTSAINPGVVRRLTVEQLAAIVLLPSPFPAHRGGKCAHLEITVAGRKRIGQYGAESR